MTENTNLSSSSFPNSTNIKNIIEDIYKNYKPIQSLSRQLISNEDSDFSHQVENKIKDLPENQKQRIRHELFGYGPIHGLIHREDIFDIIIKGPEQIFFEDGQGVHRLDDCFLSNRSFNNFIENVSQQSGLLTNQKDPYGNGQFNNLRVHLVRPPIGQQVNLTLRRLRQSQISFENLLKSHFLNESQFIFFQEMICAKKNFLVLGPTGSGKTTFLSSLINLIPETERCVIVEDTDEINVPNGFSTKLLTRELCPKELSEVSLGDLVKQSLRMRPDRLIMGEVRGGEAKDLLMALATGHSGSAGTMHAQSAHQALIRLEMLIQLGAPHWSLNAIRQLISLSLDYLIVLKSDRYEKGVMDVNKVAGHESFGLLLEKVQFN